MSVIDITVQNKAKRQTQHNIVDKTSLGEPEFIVDKDTIKLDYRTTYK